MKNRSTVIFPHSISQIIVQNVFRLKKGASSKQKRAAIYMKQAKLAAKLSTCQRKV